MAVGPTSSGIKTFRFLASDYSGANRWAFMIPYCTGSTVNRLMFGGKQWVQSSQSTVNSSILLIAFTISED